MIQRRMPTPFVSCLALALMCGPSFAQQGPDNSIIQLEDNENSQEVAAPTIETRLSEKVFESKTMGFQFTPPLQCIIQKSEQADGTNTLVVRHVNDPEPSLWQVRIQVVNPIRPGATPGEHLQAFLTRQLETGNEFAITSNRPVVFGGLSGHQLEMELPIGPGENAVTGWVVLPRPDGTFLVLTSVTRFEIHDQASRMLQESYDTISMMQAMEIADERLELLDKGAAFLGGLSRQKLEQACKPGITWYRIYRPGPTEGMTDDIEIGFMGLSAKAAPRGAVDFNRRDAAFIGDQAEEGLLVTLQAKIFMNQDPGHTVDVNGRFWTAWDRSSETFSNRRTQRQGEASRTTAQTGFRNAPTAGQPRSTLQVINSTADLLSRDPLEWTIPTGAYLSQAELLILGRLLPRDRSFTGDFGVYAFDSQSNKLSQRLDTWLPADDDSGNWILLGRANRDLPPVQQVIGPDGIRLRRIDTDGTVTELIDVGKLQDLYRSKGLPTS